MTTLNSKQQQLYSVAQQLACVLRKSKRIYNDVTPFHNEVNTFLQHLDSISTQASIKAQKGIAITAQKKALKKEIAREVADVCNLATAYALTEKNKELLYQLRGTSYTGISTSKDGQINTRIICLVHHLTPLLSNETFIQYGITSNDLTSISKKAEQFSDINYHGRWINWESNQASQTITATLKKMRDSIKQMQRLLILFKAKHPGFIEECKQALIVEEKKGSQNAIEGIINDDTTSQLLQNVTITAESNSKGAITNQAGFYHLKGLKVGKQTFTITADGYTPQTITATIIRGKTITLNISLQAEQFSMPASEVA